MFYYSPTKGEKQGLAGLQQLNTPPLLQKQKIEGGWAEERAVGVSRPNNRVAQEGDGGGRGGVEWQAFLVWLSVVELEPFQVKQLQSASIGIIWSPQESKKNEGRFLHQFSQDYRQLFKRCQRHNGPEG